MNRTVNRNLIDQWINDHAPNGISNLSVRSRVSVSTIGAARRGLVPKRIWTRTKLCKAIGVSENELFPVDATDEERAS